MRRTFEYKLGGAHQLHRLCLGVDRLFDMRPYAIETRLKLRNPIYSETAAYGHMGREPQLVEKVFESSDKKVKKVKVELFTWEKLDYVDKVKKAFRIKDETKKPVKAKK